MTAATLSLSDFLRDRFYAKRVFWELADGMGQVAEHRVDREIALTEALRQIVEEHQPVTYVKSLGRKAGGCKCGGGWPCKTIRILAAVYSDHPDFRPEWADQA